MSRLLNDTTPDYLFVDASPFATYPFTAGAWVWSDDTTIDQVVIFVGDKDVANQRHQLYLEGSGGAKSVIYLCQTAAGSVTAVTSTGYSANTWQLVVMTGISPTSRAVYINGGSKGTNATSREPTGLDRYAIGMRRSSSPGAPLSGKVDRAFVYNVALTDAEVLALYLCGSPEQIRRSALVDYRKLGYFDPEPNWVGPGNTMTVVTAARDYGTPGRLERVWGTVPVIGVAAAVGPPEGSLMLSGVGR